MFLAAFCTVLAILFLALKFGKGFMKRLIGMDWLVDIAVTIFFVWLFAITGTISGMMTGIFAGLMISIMLLAARAIFPHQRLVRKGSKLEWEDRDGILVEKAKQAMKDPPSLMKQRLNGFKFP